MPTQQTRYSGQRKSATPARSRVNGMVMDFNSDQDKFKFTQSEKTGKHCQICHLHRSDVTHLNFPTLKPNVCKLLFTLHSVCRTNDRHPPGPREPLSRFWWLPPRHEEHAAHRCLCRFWGGDLCVSTHATMLHYLMLGLRDGTCWLPPASPLGWIPSLLAPFKQGTTGLTQIQFKIELKSKNCMTFKIRCYYQQTSR